MIPLCWYNSLQFALDWVYSNHGQTNTPTSDYNSYGTLSQISSAKTYTHTLHVLRRRKRKPPFYFLIEFGSVLAQHGLWDGRPSTRDARDARRTSHVSVIIALTRYVVQPEIGCGTVERKDLKNS